MGDGPPEGTNPAADRIREDSPKRVQSHARPGSLETIFFQNGAVKLHAVAAGPNDGPIVVLLHGFPEFWYGWHRQIEPLTAAGFRVIVPDQRGYNLSSKPSAGAAYALPALVSDAIPIATQPPPEKNLP